MEISLITKNNQFSPALGNILFLGVTLIILLTSSFYQQVIWLTAAISLIIFATYHFKLIKLTPLFLSFCLFVLMLIINSIFISPNYNPMSTKIIVFISFSYLLGRSLSFNTAYKYYRTLIYLFCILALWAIYQYVSLSAYIVPMHFRSNTFFHTPNSYAAAINLLLVPLITLYISGFREKFLLFVIGLIIFSLLLTVSRGGWLSFTCAMIFGLILLFWHHGSIKNKAVIKFVILITALILSFIVYDKLLKTAVYDQFFQQAPVIEAEIGKKNIFNKTNERVFDYKISSIKHRFLLYEIAWREFKQHALFGIGIDNFIYILERDKTKEIFKFENTRFVHNDYLQLLLETGVIGFSGLIIFLASIYIQAWSCLKKQAANKLLIIAILTGITSLLCHAVVDFVFYVPFLMFVFGGMLGILDQEYSRHLSVKELNIQKNITPIRFGFYKTIIIMPILVLLFMPLLAHMSIYSARVYKKHNQFIKAQDYYASARRLAPHNAGYICEEAKLWMMAAKINNDSGAAEMADKLLYQGVELNPYEQKCLLARSILHREDRDFLKHPVDINTILKWQERVIHWQPHNLEGHKEYINTLRLAGKQEELEKHINKLEGKIQEYMKQGLLK